MIEVIGQTSDGKKVVRGVYRFFETYGLPLDVVFEMLLLNNMIPCWISFYRECIVAGLKHDRILAKLDHSVSDSYGPDIRNRAIATLHILKKIYYI